MSAPTRGAKLFGALSVIVLVLWVLFINDVFFVIWEMIKAARRQ